MARVRIDLNCDLGEGGLQDAELMPLITSANIACGAHAGDPAAMAASLRLARRHGVQVGAHPGFPDRQNFGRTELPFDDERIWQDCVYQVGALLGLARGVGVSVGYVKPHGALYNLSGRDRRFAASVVRAVKVFGLAIMGLPRSELQKEAEAQGLPFIAEGFADRRYHADGSLVPRTMANALIHDPIEAAAQAQELIRNHGVQSICVHGDNPRAVEFVRHLRKCLLEGGARNRRIHLARPRRGRVSP
jgi:UPF0271 protein